MKFVCHNCRSQHEPIGDLWQRWVDWIVKHDGHDVAFTPGPVGYKDNANVNEGYASSAAYAITLTSLATSSTLLTGVQSTAIVNTGNIYPDYYIGGKIRMGAIAPTQDTTIEVWGYGAWDDVPTYSDTLTGSNSTISLTSANVKRGLVRLVDRLFVDNSANRTYYVGPVYIGQIFGGRVPKNHGLFVTQNSGQALSATGTDHALNYTGQYQVVN